MAMLLCHTPTGGHGPAYLLFEVAEVAEVAEPLENRQMKWQGWENQGDEVAAGQSKRGPAADDISGGDSAAQL